MPIVTKESMLLALKNIASFGDTDIFPFPNENHLFHDRPEDVVSVLNEIDNDFKASISRMPVLTSKELAVVGYGGFRQGTQIDPIWNAYLLSLVIEAGIDIEKRRVTPNVVFSIDISLMFPLAHCSTKMSVGHSFRKQLQKMQPISHLSLGAISRIFTLESITIEWRML